MQAVSQPIAPSKTGIWIGRIISGVIVLFLLLDGVLHIAKPAPVVEAFGRLGIPVDRALGLGVVLLACVAIHPIPRTAVVGAVLISGYLGGAIAIHMRAGSTPFETLFPLIVAALLWGGLLLRDRRARAMIAPAGDVD